MVSQLTSTSFSLSPTGEFLIIPCSSEKAAIRKATIEKSLWADWAFRLRCRSARFVYGRKKDDYVCVLAQQQEDLPMEAEFGSIISPATRIMGMAITPGVLRGLNTIASNPEEQWFMHRLSPDLKKMTQIAISESAASLIIGESVASAIGRDRSDYTPPEDLYDLTTAIRQNLSVGGAPIYHTFTIFSPVTKADYRRVKYRYEIIEELPTGEVIQLGQCLEVERIPSPVLV